MRYHPHESVTSHLYYRDSTLESIVKANAGTPSFERILEYLVANEASIDRAGRFWDHSKRAFIAAVRWDYDRQWKDADGD